MDYKVKRSGDAAIMLLIGSVNGKRSLLAFKRGIDHVLGLGVNHIVLNMEKLDYINSSGLGQLIMLEQEVVKNGGLVKAVKVSENILSVLKITRLSEIISIYPDEESALKDF